MAASWCARNCESWRQARAASSNCAASILLAGSTHCDVNDGARSRRLWRHPSTETVRNVITDRAHGVFQGQIRVDREAQKTDAKMACNTLLLSDEAQFSTKPELEIFADDVACGHGAPAQPSKRNTPYHPPLKI